MMSLPINEAAAVTPTTLSEDLHRMAEEVRARHAGGHEGEPDHLDLLDTGGWVSFWTAHMLRLMSVSGGRYDALSAVRVGGTRRLTQERRQEGKDAILGAESSSGLLKEEPSPQRNRRTTCTVHEIQRTQKV